MSSERILVLGGTGFIGQRLVPKLLEQDNEIDLLVHRQPYLAPGTPALRITVGDLLDKEETMRSLSSNATIINLVGSFFDALYPVNVQANLNLLEAARKAGVRKILFLSSQHIYGECTGKPFKESDAPQPVTPYGLTKYLAETIYQFYSRNYGIPCIILRLSNVYGPGQRAGAIFNFIDSALKSQPITLNNQGKQIRDFLYVDDAVAAILQALDYKPKTGFEVFNIAGPEARRLLEMVALIQKSLPQKATVKHCQSKEPDIQWMWSDCQKARSMLNYEPKVSLEEGIPRTIEEISSRGNKKYEAIL